MKSTHYFLTRFVTICTLVQLFVLPPGISAQIAGQAASSDSALWRATSRDANSTVWEASGTRVRRYVEIGSGLNYQDESGNWRASEDLIELQPDGSAAALRGQSKLHFNPNLNVAGAITITTVNKRVLRTHILGLYYFDAATGQSALIAPIQDSNGELLPPNQVMYHDAFRGVKADVRFTYTKSGFECDVILLEKPLPPENFGLSAKVSRLEIWHEFLEPPDPQTRTNILKRQTDATLRQTMEEPDLVDETLDFGDLWFPLGRAFASEVALSSDSSTPAQIRLASPSSDTNRLFVAKRWLQVGPRNLLIESVDWSDLAPRIASLPQAGRVASAGNLKERVMEGRRLPEPQLATKRSVKPMRVAAASYLTQGFVFDYIAVPSSGSDYTFSSGTYFINGSTYFSGTLTFSGGVIKLSDNSYLLTYGSVAGGGSILTSKDDDLYGEKIPGSTGNPTYAGNPALWLYYRESGVWLGSMKIRWAHTAVQFDPTYDNSGNTIQYSALEQCQVGLYAQGYAFGANVINNSTQCGRLR